MKKFIIHVQHYSIVGCSSVLIQAVPLAIPLILSPSVTDSDAPCCLPVKLEIEKSKGQVSFTGPQKKL
jgi:hypothetical protein